jgi:hypothetical protein
MAYNYITDNTATQCETGRVRRVLVTVNEALTGTIKVIDNTAGTTANVATITNPSAGTAFLYFDFKTGVRIIASGACNITVFTDNRY